MAILGKGVKFRYKNGADIGDLLNIELPEISADEVDVTTHGSADNWREFMSGLKNGGEVSVEFIYDDGDEVQLQLLSDVGGAVKDFEIEFPDRSLWSFSALVKSFTHTAPLDDKITGSVSLKISGQPVFTLAGS